MELHVISTGSDGNCYFLTHGNDTLILDCGVKMRQIYLQMRRGNRYACLVTHEHADHAKAVSACLKAGIAVYASQGTIDAMGIANNPIFPAKPTAIKSKAQIKVCGFTVLPFSVEHDSAEPLGFLIRRDDTGETALYATDTHSIRFKLPHIDYWIVECNYTKAMLQRRYDEGQTGCELMGRLPVSHMSLETLLEVLDKNNASTAKMIVLIHLSFERADEALMVQSIEDQTGVRTIAADNATRINLSDTPF